ncbi:MAG: hypothetical protein CVV64_20150 [Candidatus Wallbacteria bacterium HGW-Wallbacteria-1]|jgi:hypothetical protein|uniref:Uncharacterized protein n=1 Tax=Candidatus Wallbacteria bacterium HGW-Wallbacteria-1 TaxID=2013854 RepID=A0A2N1PIH8_9BACT|nr:MAG: hypothetical protein CVV64_20150 [Candidatus Wallbacteria bacterium HGW-Wallbacteria-1]
MKIIIDGPESKIKLPNLLEGYLYGLGEVCHSLFGAQGEAAIYSAIGSFFLKYLREHNGIEFSENDPWKRYCHIIEVFTSYGFYSHVELEQNMEIEPSEKDSFWMFETNQYAGQIWEKQDAWKRGTPPCPLWSTILYSLSEINYTIVLDSVIYNSDCNGFESTFHFTKLKSTKKDLLSRVRKTIRSVIIPICAHCKKIHDDDGRWISNDEYFTEHYDANFTHGICPECCEKHYPEIEIANVR